MGADFCFAYLPKCNMTPERIEIAKGLITDDEDSGRSRDDILAWFENYLDGDYDKSRDIGETAIRGVTYYITGGMSWGDSPTDYYDEFNALGQIFDWLEGWALEDNENTP